jgi:hypothetical protein
MDKGQFNGGGKGNGGVLHEWSLGAANRADIFGGVKTRSMFIEVSLTRATQSQMAWLQYCPSHSPRSPVRKWIWTSIKIRFELSLSETIRADIYGWIKSNTFNKTQSRAPKSHPEPRAQVWNAMFWLENHANFNVRPTRISTVRAWSIWRVPKARDGHTTFATKGNRTWEIYAILEHTLTKHRKCRNRTISSIHILPPCFKHVFGEMMFWRKLLFSNYLLKFDHLLTTTFKPCIFIVPNWQTTEPSAA